MITCGLQRELDDSKRLIGAFRRRRFRTLAQFAEDEIVVPSGPHANERLRLSTQPFSRLLYDEIDSGKYSEIVVTGPSQTGKTLLAWVVPMLFHLFEICETVIAAVPDGDMIRDKLEQDIEPVLRRTRYWRYMPAIGKGSKGGNASLIAFKNGAQLRWMTAGGSDKRRAGFTARVVCMTETDGFDVRTSTSSEASKIAQIEARTRSYPRNLRRIYKECTVSTKTAHTWARYQAGTASRIATPCPHCGSFETLERADLAGWQDADTDVAAGDQACFHCPSCGEQWAEDERKVANSQAVLVHANQSVVGGAVVGITPRTRTLGFRWNAANNMLITAGDIGVDEWEAARATDEDDAQRKQCQFVWATPYVPLEDDNDSVTAEQISRQTSDFARGQYPPDAFLTLGIDVNKPVLHWTVMAFRMNGDGFVVDYGRQGLRTKDIGFQKALADGLMKLREKLDGVYPYRRAAVDSRWKPDDVSLAIKSLKDKRWRPFVGCGKGQFLAQSYYHPTQISGDVIWAGTANHEKLNRVRSQVVIYADANFWKTQVKSRLVLDGNGDSAKTDGPIRLYRTVDDGEHYQFGRHITAEEEEYVLDPKGKGMVRVYRTIRKANHWLDSTYIATVLSDKVLRSPRIPARGGAITTTHQPRTYDSEPMEQGFSVPNFSYEGHDR